MPPVAVCVATDGSRAQVQVRVQVQVNKANRFKLKNFGENVANAAAAGVSVVAVARKLLFNVRQN